MVFDGEKTCFTHQKPVEYVDANPYIRYAYQTEVMNVVFTGVKYQNLQLRVSLP